MHRKTVPRKLNSEFTPWLGCDIGGAKERAGAMYFPTNWGVI